MIDILKAFDQYLGEERLSFECVVIGGAALIHLGIITRRTDDVDLLDPDIPEDIKLASISFATKNPQFELVPDHWFNSGPKDLKRDLPKGWRQRLVNMMEGENLFLLTLGRDDLLKTKLFACADRDEDFDDCVALKPTEEELLNSINWVKVRDTNPLWPDHVEDVFQRIKKGLGYA